MRHAIIALTFALVIQTVAHAADIQVLSAAAMQTVLKEVAAEFERSSGHKLVIAYATMGAIDERVAKGETPQVVIHRSASMSRLVADGRIDPASARSLARVGLGRGLGRWRRCRHSPRDDHRGAGPRPLAEAENPLWRGRRRHRSHAGAG